MKKWFKITINCMILILLFSLILPSYASAELDSSETEVDKYWKYENGDLGLLSVPRTSNLSGYVNTSSGLQIYDEVVFDDPYLIDNTSSEDLNYNDTDNLSSYSKIEFEDTTSPIDSEDNYLELSKAYDWITPALKAATYVVGAKIYVRQYLKETTKKILVRNGKLAGKSHPKTNVKFTKNGFPKFEHKYQVKLPKAYWKSSNTRQFNWANERLKRKIEINSIYSNKFTVYQQLEIRSGKTPSGYVWHHHERTGYLQLVDKNVHKRTGHTGGKSIWGSL